MVKAKPIHFSTIGPRGAIAGALVTIMVTSQPRGALGYMTALSERDVPIVALPGEGYELDTGYFLRPITLTPEEARAHMTTTIILGA